MFVAITLWHRFHAIDGSFESLIPPNESSMDHMSGGVAGDVVVDVMSHLPSHMSGAVTTTTAPFTDGFI